MLAKHCLIIGLFFALSASSGLADEFPDRLATAALVERDPAGVYKLEWQRRLLAIQHAFAEELIRGVGIDHTATGSITPTDLARPLQ